MTENETPTRRFATLFRGNENWHGSYHDADTDDAKKIFTLSGGATEPLFADHLRGYGPYLGVIPIMQDGLCWFGALDIDDSGIDHKALAQKVHDLNLPLVVCRSKSGGAHLYIFFSEPVDAALVQQKLTEWCVALGHAKNPDDRKTEIFPKQKRLKAKEKGSWINLPYYKEGDTARPAINRDGTTLPLELFLTVAEMKRVNETALRDMRASGADPFDDGPPCLKALHATGFPSGSRNNGLYNVACYFKLAFADDWQDRVREYNQQHFDPPKPSSEVEPLIKSVEQRDYIYKCDELPLQPHCDKKACRKQTYGIGGFRRRRNLDRMPVLADLRKVLTDPPQWLVEINSVEVQLTTEELMSCMKLRKAALEKSSLLIPMLKQAEYDDLLQELLLNHSTIEAPDDAGTQGQFEFLLSQFLELRAKSDSRDDLLRNLPFEEDGKVYFRSNNLLNFLQRKGFREYDARSAWSALRKLGAGHHQFNIKKACVQVWWVPLPTNEQQEEFTVGTGAAPVF